MAGTEAMPAWDEGCKRADEKTPEETRRPSIRPKALHKTALIAHPSASEATRVPPTTSASAVAPRKPRHALL